MIVTCTRRPSLEYANSRLQAATQRQCQYTLDNVRTVSF